MILKCWICGRDEKQMIKDGFEKNSDESKIKMFDSACYQIPLCDVCQDIIGKISFDISEERIKSVFKYIGTKLSLKSVCY